MVTYDRLPNRRLDIMCVVRKEFAKLQFLTKWDIPSKKYTSWHRLVSAQFPIILSRICEYCMYNLYILFVFVL